MIKGIGVDMVHLPRVIEKHARLASRVLTANEYKQYSALDDERKITYFAGRFAAKEAYYKAAGDSSLGYQNFEVINNDNGIPTVNNPAVFLSLTHDGDYVIAFVVIEGK